jgi:hypothetical protein
MDTNLHKHPQCMPMVFLFLHYRSKAMSERLIIKEN